MKQYKLYDTVIGMTRYSRHYRSGDDIYTVQAKSAKQAYYCAVNRIFAQSATEAGIVRIGNSQKAPYTLHEAEWLKERA